MHDGHVGGPKQYNDLPLGNIFYFYANILYCFSPPTWPPCTHSIEGHWVISFLTVMFYPFKIKSIVLYCIVLYCTVHDFFLCVLPYFPFIVIHDILDAVGCSDHPIGVYQSPSTPLAIVIPKSLQDHRLPRPCSLGCLGSTDNSFRRAIATEKFLTIAIATAIAY